MNQGFGKQARRAGVALGAAAAFALLCTGAAHAQQFTSAGISLDNAGNLQCKFREIGFGAIALVTYDCAAEGVAVVSACFIKNKFVPDSLSVSIVKDVTVEESEPLLTRNNGAINGTITVEVPEGGGEARCNETAGAEPHTVAVRWCNASLIDVTTNPEIVGATADDLIAVLLRTGSEVALLPTCAEILAFPGDGGHE